MDLSRVVIGHAGDSTDLTYLEELIANGSYLGMDRFGINTISPFEDRVATVAALCERGHAGRMVLSHDSYCFNDRFDHEVVRRRHPDYHLLHISRDVLPELRRRGVTEEQIHRMLVANPATSSRGASRTEAVPSPRGPSMIDADDFDVSAAWHVAAPYDFLRRLRHERPVFRSEHLGAHVLTRYADVRAAYGDPKRFSSAGSLTISRSLSEETRLKLGEHGSFLSSFVANVDPPVHTRLRRSVSRAFTPRAVAAMEQRFRELNEDLLDRVAPRGGADFVTEIAHEPSAKLTARFIGVPEEDEEFVKEHVKGWFQLFLSPQPPDRQLALAESFLAYLDYVDRLVAARARDPRDDFTSLMTS
nr:hypothetical protein GCM10020093_109870 [Planobispora longispora]